VGADLEAIDRRLRDAGGLTEVHLQERLRDAGAQQQRASQLLEQRGQQPSTLAVAPASPAAALAGGPAAAPPAIGSGASPGAAARPPPPLQLASQRVGLRAGGPSAPGTPSNKARPASGPAGAGTAACGAPGDAAAEAAPAAVPAPEGDGAAAAAAALVDALLDNTGPLDACYSRLLDLVSSRWPVREAQAPGLLLLQRDPACPTPGALAAGSLPEGGLLRAPPDTSTALRLRAVTAASAALQLPRGQHVLRVACSHLLLHAASFACNSPAVTEFEVEAAATASPSAGAAPAAPMGPASVGALQREGDHEPLRAGGQHLLFRFQLRVSEPCAASARLACSSAALAAAARLLVIDNATGAVASSPINQISGLQVRGRGGG
jgi:hypothetical protein